MLLMTAQAAPVQFKINPALDARQSALISSKTDFEDFVGRTNKLQGTITFDPKAKTGTGTISLDGATIDTGIALRNEHMRGEYWLNFDKDPQVQFTASKVTHLKNNNYQVEGKLKLHGVTKMIRTVAEVKYLPASPTTASAGFKGDVISLKTKFNIKLSDYGVKIPEQAAAKVNNTLGIQISVIADSGQ